MCINVHSTLLLHDGYLAFDRDPLDFDARDDGGMRELTTPGVQPVPHPVSDPATAEEVLCNG
jgi:hypothetical protein